MSLFEIDPDISRASTISSSFYTSEENFAASKERIFARSWQLVGTTDEIDNLKPVTILPNFLDEPVLFTNDENNIRCLSNVCTHRGKILVEEQCRANGIRCGYHGRRFGLDGSFISMPEFDGAKDFPTDADDLTKVPFDVLGKLLFASPQPTHSFQEFFSPVNERLTWLDWSTLKFSAEHSREYFVDAHWALYCENYLEGFHIPFVHHSLNEVIDYGTYSTETFRFVSLQTAFSDGEIFETAMPFAKYPVKVAALYFFVFPNLMLNFYPWGLSVNIVKPLRKDLTNVTYMTFISDQTKLGEGAGADLARVEFEDQSVVESVQRGINSRFYDSGRYSPTREQGTHHFHRLIAEFMNL